MVKLHQLAWSVIPQLPCSLSKKGQRGITKSFLLYEDAERWARKTESDLERGTYIESDNEARKTIIKDAAASFELEHLSRLKHSHRESNRLWALLDRTRWGSLALTNLKPRDVADYVRKREKEGMAPDTIRLDLTLLSKLYKHARTEWDMESLRNPVDAVRRPSLRGTARTRRLEDGEEETLLVATKSELKPIILFALETAMRREEIATLTWEHVNLANKIVFLPTTKNGEARSVPLSGRAVTILQSLPRNIDNHQPVFGLNKDQITDKMRTTVKRAGLDNLRFHDLRHEATSRLFERGTLDMMEIATITGHKTLTMLRRYTHLRAEKLVQKMG